MEPDSAERTHVQTNAGLTDRLGGDRSAGGRKPFVSVVVPAYNEEYVLANCLAALQAQDYPGPCEVIVVNNASTDRTAEIARSMGVTLVDEPVKGYVYALRAGFTAARGEIIACTDADTLVPPGWVSNLVAHLTSRPGIVATSGSFEFYDGPGWLRTLCRILSRCSWHLAGANMAMWRWAYDAVAGFDPTVNMGADVELGMRLQRVGRLCLNQGPVAATSARRFEVSFWPALWQYAINDLALILTGRPHFFHFPDVRIPPRSRLTRRQVSLAGVALASVLLMLFGAFVLTAEGPGAQTFGAVVARVRADQPVVALTFDDGPSEYTAQVLDILARYDVKATFFLVGLNAERHPDLARRIVSEGHVIGNHTYSHPVWAAIEDSQHVGRELDNGQQAIARVTGVAPTLFRPPHGWRSPWMVRLAHARGYTVVTWSVSPDDWRRPAADVIATRVLQQARSGAIVLLHDGLDTQISPPVQNTVKALPAIIEGLRGRGYRFVTVPELMEDSEMPEIRVPPRGASCAAPHGVTDSDCGSWTTRSGSAR